MAKEQTAVAVFDPHAAARSLTNAVEDRREQFAALLGVELESERGKAIIDRFVTVALHAATSRPDLMAATTESLLESIRDAAMLGLEPVGATGDGSIVVYKEKVIVERPGPNGGMIRVEETRPTAHFQAQYRGLLKLTRRSNEIAHIDAHVVYAGDEIEIDLGSSPVVRHHPVLDGTQRGNPVGAYAVAELRNGRRYVDWMTYADIEVTRRQSRAKDALAWTSFWSEMARKTVLRRLMKRLPLEAMAEMALRLENQAEERAAPELPAIAGSDARSRIRARLGAGAPEVETADTSEPEPAAVSVDPARGDLCGAASDPGLGPEATCVLEAGHTNKDETPSPHKAADGSVWPNKEKA